MHFNSHAHVERDCVLRGNTRQSLYFNSHAHVERDTYNASAAPAAGAFQLTRSRGAWLKISWDMQLVKLFQLTRSRGAWRFATGTNYQETSAFQLTRSRGAWLSTTIFNTTALAFQLTRSRGAWHRFYHIISSDVEFQLTRSRGAWLQKYQRIATYTWISTHTLTWSVTCLFYRLQ